MQKRKPRVYKTANDWWVITPLGAMYAFRSWQVAIAFATNKLNERYDYLGS